MNLSNFLITLNTLDFKIIFIWLIITNVIFLLIFFIDIPIPISITFFLIPFFSFPSGYALLKPSTSISNLPIMIRFVLYLSLGIGINVMWSYFLSFQSITPLHSFSLLLLSSFFILFHRISITVKLNKDIDGLELNKKFKTVFNFSSDKRFTLFFIFLVLFSSSFVFIKFNEFNWWPPYGDYENHATYTAIQLLEGKLTDHIPFFPTSKFVYPMGFHFFAGSNSLLFDLTPPELILVFGGILVVLIGLLIFSISYQLTRSIWLSSIVLIAGTYVAPVLHNLDSYYWGLFVQGMIPNLGGFVLILFSISYVLSIKKLDFFFYILTPLILFSSGIFYPSSIFYVLVILLSCFLINKPWNSLLTNSSKIYLSKRKIGFYYFSFYLITVIGLGSKEISNHLKFVFASTKSQISEISKIYSNLERYFLGHFFTIAIIMGIISSTFLIFYSKQKLFGVIVLFVILLQLFSPYLDIFSSFISPARYGILTLSMSWMSIAVLVSIESNKKDKNVVSNISRYNNSVFLLTNTKKKYFLYGMFGLFSLYLLIPTIPFSNEFYSQFGSTTSSIQDYLPAMKWIAENASSDDLILTYVDPGNNNRIFNWINSIKYVRHINGEHITTYNPILDITTKIAMSNYKNDAYLHKILAENDIKYILTTTNEKRFNIISKYPFLQVEYNDGFSTIYSVIPIKFNYKQWIDNELNQISKILDSNKNWNDVLTIKYYISLVDKSSIIEAENLINNKINLKFNEIKEYAKDGDSDSVLSMANMILSINPQHTESHLLIQEILLDKINSFIQNLKEEDQSYDRTS